MASIYKRGDSVFWWIRTRDNQRRSLGIRIDSKDGLRKAKIEQAKETAKEMQRGKINVQHGWQRWVNAWMERRYASSPKTLTRYRECWSSLSVYLDEIGVGEPTALSRENCLNFMTWRVGRGAKPAKHNTALLELKFLGTIMQEAVNRGMCSANPAYRLGVGRKQPKRKHEIKAEEEELIRKKLKTMPSWMVDSFDVAMKQGCRISETATAIEDISLKGTPTITFRIKGGRLHTAALHPDLVALVKKRKAAGEKCLVSLPQYAPRLWWQFLKRIGLPHLSFHSTRVSVVTRMAQANLPKYKIMDYVGHASSTVNDVYRRLQPADFSDCQKVL